MFTFEDLGNLDPGGVQTLLSAADKDKLGTALKGASETLRDFFFSNMSERAAKLMKEDMQSLGPVRLKDVDEAQMYMVATAKELAERGEIIISENTGEEDRKSTRLNTSNYCASPMQSSAGKNNKILSPIVKEA